MQGLGADKAMIEPFSGNDRSSTVPELNAIEQIEGTNLRRGQITL